LIFVFSKQIYPYLTQTDLAEEGSHPIKRNFNFRSWLGALFLSILSSFGAIGFFIYCYVKTGKWDIYFDTVRIGWGLVGGDLTRIWNPIPLFAGLTFSGVFPHETGLFFTLVFILLLCVINFWAVRRRKKLPLEYISLLLLTDLLLLETYVAKANTSLGGMLRYLIPVAALCCVLIVPWSTQKLQEYEDGKPVNINWGIALLIFAMGCFAVEVCYIFRFYHAIWVA
jgi:hypothetical protein